MHSAYSSVGRAADS